MSTDNKDYLVHRLSPLADLTETLYEALCKYRDYRSSGMAGSSSQKARQMRAETNDAIEAALAKYESKS